MAAVAAPLAAQTLETLFAPYSFTSPVAGTMPYRLMAPEGAVPGQQYPLLVVLHGLGGKGTDNLAQLPMGSPQLDPYVRANFKSYTLLPQGGGANNEYGDFQSFGLWGDPATKSMAAQPTPSGRMVLELVEHLLATTPAIDPARVYLVGQSMGGSGVFELLARRPDLFAAGLPVYLGGTPDTCSAIAAADIPIRLMNDDQSIPWSRDRLLLLGADVAHIAKFTGDTGHGAYTNQYAYDDYALFRWMFSQRKGGPRVRVRHTDGTTVVVEYGAGDSYEVWLKTQPAANVVVTPLPDSQVTVSPASLTFTPANWATKQTVTVSAVNDTVTEGTHAGLIRHAAASADPGYHGAPIQQLEVVVQEGDAKVRFSHAEWTVGEADGSVTLTVQLEGNVTGAVSVEYATVAAGGATAGADYTPVSGTLNWPDGDRSPRQIVVPILDDALSEGAEAFEVRLANGVGLQLGEPATAIVRITDDEYAGVLRIVAKYATVAEHSGDITFTVARADGSLGPASVEVATLNGTALAGSDFHPVAATLTWADGDTEEKPVTIFLINDAHPEPTETFTLALGNPVGAGLGAPSSVVVTIEDDDGYTVSVVDAFDDGGRSDGADPKDLAWWYSGTGSQIAVREFVAGLTKTMGSGADVRPATNQMIVAALPSAVTLTNVGDYLEIACDLSRTRADNFHSNIRIGFFNIDPAAIPTADNYGPAAFNAALGYTAELPAEGQTNRTLRLREDTDIASNRLVDNQNASTGQLLAVSNAAIYLPSGANPRPSTLPLTVVFTLTRVEGGVELKLVSDLGPAVYSVTDAVAPFTTFNTVAFGWGSTATDIHFDNIAITSGGPVVYSPDKDSDGDGQSDYDEHVAGTDPHSGASFFRAELVTVEGGAVLAFPTIIGRQYRVESSGSLAPGAVWEAVQDWTAGTGAVMEVPVAGPAPGQPRFHRVGARIP